MHADEEQQEKQKQATHVPHTCPAARRRPRHTWDAHLHPTHTHLYTPVHSHFSFLYSFSLSSSSLSISFLFCPFVFFRLFLSYFPSFFCFFRLFFYRHFLLIFLSSSPLPSVLFPPFRSRLFSPPSFLSAISLFFLLLLHTHSALLSNH